MGTWNNKIDGNDTFQDVYQNYFDLYNQGQDPADVSKKIQEDFAEMFNDYEDRNNSLFGLALAQWETRSLDATIFEQVKEIIETGNDLDLWKELDADEKTLKQRKVILDKFLARISTDRKKPKRRVRLKFDFTAVELIKQAAPDNNKVFEAHEYYTNGIYEQTGSGITWATGGGSVFYFIGQGLYVSARWLDSQTLEVRHDKNIVFTQKDETFFYFGDQGRIIYIADERN